MNAISDTRYAKSHDVYIAYQVVSGSGDLDLVAIPPGVSNIEVLCTRSFPTRTLSLPRSSVSSPGVRVSGMGVNSRVVSRPAVRL